MRAQLYNEPPLTVSPSLAAAVGLNEAIVLQQVHYWTQNSEKNGINIDNRKKAPQVLNRTRGAFFIFRYTNQPAPKLELLPLLFTGKYISK